MRALLRLHLSKAYDGGTSISRRTISIPSFLTSSASCSLSLPRTQNTGRTLRRRKLEESRKATAAKKDAYCDGRHTAVALSKAGLERGNRGGLDIRTQSSTVPPVLRRGMDLPKVWDKEGGTIVLVDKPQGWTSFDVCAKVRKVVQVKKVGHAGTLDPMATGLLVICVGPATKLADWYQGFPKVYTGTFRLGEATATCDAESPVNDKKHWEHILDNDIENVKESFIGEIDQVPPMFSAIQVGGERLYEKARRGESIDVPARKVIIYEFEIHRSEQDRQELDFRVCCSKGTYIRSLCADFGTALDSCAYLTRLRREKIGDLCVHDAWAVEELAQAIYRHY